MRKLSTGPRALGAVLVHLAAIASVMSTMALMDGLDRAQAAEPTPAQQRAVFDAAKAIGRAKASDSEASVRDGSSEAVVRRNVSGYTAAPAGAQIYGTNDTSTPVADQQAYCAANPRDANCSAVTVGSQPRNTASVQPSAQALASRAAVRNPNLVLGDIASTYNACSVGGRMIAPEQWQGGNYLVITEPWTDSNCTKTLSVSPVERRSCQDGSVIASAYLGGPGDMTASAYCNVLTGSRVRFQVNAWGIRGSCTGPLDVTLDLSRPPAAGAQPHYVGQIQPHWGGGCYPLAVYWDGPGCVAGQCQVNIHFADPLSYVYGCTTAGALPGSQINFDYYVAPDPAGAMCYAAFADDVAAGGRPGGWGTSVDLAAYWAQIEPATVLGWQWPGMNYVAQLSFAEPTLTPAGGERWTNGCAALEALTPGLPPDGAQSPAQPVLPSTAVGIGVQQCVRTASVCTDGPSVRVIDGVSVARQCWSYTNAFACTALAPSSSVIDVARTCERAGPVTCDLTDVQGHCIYAHVPYQCRTGAAVFDTALNCGASSFCSGGSCWDTNYNGNTNFLATYSQYQARVEAGQDIDPVTLTIFKGRDSRCHRDNFGIDNCCQDSAYLQNCQQEEQKTVLDRDAGKCHQVGTYCSASSFGICRERTESYCCFSSLLGRIIQEQGRVQLVRDWGTPTAPNCAGFTPDELAQLDWSQFDLSEFYAQIQANPPDPSRTTDSALGKQPQCYYGSGNCGGGS